jgi:hypothetical protein
MLLHGHASWRDESRVGAQWRGLARQFRRQVKTDDVTIDRVLPGITAPLRARLRRHPKLRREQIAGAERCYRAAIPSAFRIGDLLVNTRRAAFRITEIRLSATWIACDDWQDDYRELGVGVCRFDLALTDGVLSETWTPIATASLHAISRRLERGQDASHQALVTDLACLATPPAAANHISTADGAWAGAMVATTLRRGDKVMAFNARTWFDPRE